MKRTAEEVVAADQSLLWHVGARDIRAPEPLVIVSKRAMVHAHAKANPLAGIAPEGPGERFGSAQR